MTFPNIDYAFAGYDIVKGYPLTTARDPGFKKAIFKADYVRGKSNGDCRYLVPKGVKALQDVSCDVSFKSDTVRNTAEFHKSLATSASVEGGGFGFSFSASASYQKKTSEMSSGEYVYIISKAQCTSYFSEIDLSSLPPFDEGFQSFATKLEGASSTDQDVSDFIETYGTHFLESVTFGSSYTQEHRMKSTDYKTMSSQKFGVTARASYSGLFSAGGGFSLDSEQQAAASEFNKKVETSTVTVGSAPPSNGDAMTWASVVKESPVPIKYKLRPIADLFTTKFGNNKPTVYEKLKDAPLKSCRLIKSQGEPISCEIDRKWATLDKVVVRGGYPFIKGVSNLFSTVTLGTQTDCKLICDFNRMCVGYMTPKSGSICSIVEKGKVYEWEGSTTHTFNLYLNKMKEDLVLKARVPKVGEFVSGSFKRFFAYSYPLEGGDAKKAENLKKCRQYCVNDPLCRAFRFGKCTGTDRLLCNDQMCFIFHNIANLKSENLADTEFHFVAK